jgi:hypothetical protein
MGFLQEKEGWVFFLPFPNATTGTASVITVHTILIMITRR